MCLCWSSVVWVHIYYFQDTVLVIGFLADFTAAYSSNSGMNMDITLKTNNNEYTFNTINSDNAVVLQKIQVTRKPGGFLQSCFSFNVVLEMIIKWQKQ